MTSTVPYKPMQLAPAPGQPGSVASNLSGGVGFGGVKNLSSNSNPNATGNTSAYLNSVLPGFSDLSASATGVIGNLLKGLPNPGTVQQENATFGVNSGLGTGSGFLQARGADLYGQQADQYQQRGLNDLLSTIQGYSGTVVPTAGQALQNTQFQQAQNQQADQFGQNLQLQQFQAMLQALGLGNSITNTGNQPLPSMTL